jgi:hypothetical protein
MQIQADLCFEFFLRVLEKLLLFKYQQRVGMAITGSCPDRGRPFDPDQ